MEVQGGHIVRSTGRKDRHSKVCTAKGPRDRRVRLSAHTAIQFYDVQDRLGFDRPSKAVDWLIKKAKASIDELAELPAWNPTTSAAAAAAQQEQHLHQPQIMDEHENLIDVHHGAMETVASGSRRTTTTMVGSDGGRVLEADVHNLQPPQMGENPNNGSSFLPASLDSDSIADTIKSFFPTGASAETTHSPAPMQFQNYPPDLLSRTSSQSQDLRLSLQSFRDPIDLLHRHRQPHQQQHQAQTHHQNEQMLLFSGTTPLGFDGSSAGWSEHQHHPAEIGRFPRMIAWNAAGAETGSGSSGTGGGFIFNSPQPPPLYGQNQFFPQRGPLQSSNNSPSVRAWVDPSIATATAHNHQIPPTFHQSSISGIGFATGGFSGFHIPARIQGEEEHDGISDKPSSASSDSRH